MVKAVVGEESRLKLAEDRLEQSSPPAQVGLVIGRLSSALDRGFVFDLVPTPSNDAGEPPFSLVDASKDDRKKGTKAKSPAADSSTLVIDKEWVAEHARQVSRMLLGGINVIGIYVWLSESAFKNSTLILCQTVKEVAEAAPLSNTDSDERLLIHISYSPRRWTCRNCLPSSNIASSSLRPCDFKMGRVLPSFQTFKCNYHFNLRLPIIRDSASNALRLRDAVRNGIFNHAKELKGAKATIDSSLVVDDEPCTSADLHEVELLLPFLKDASIEVCSQRDVDGILLLRGSICSFAYLNSKEPASVAVSEIKGDIITSLHSRLDIICDDVEGTSNPTDDTSGEISDQISPEKPISELTLHLLRKKCTVSFPRRVLVPWLAGTYICDYLQPSETTEVLKDHCVELMSMEAPMDTSAILEPEAEAAPSLSTESFWDVAVPFNLQSRLQIEKSGNNTTRGGSSTKSNKPAFDNLKLSVFFLLISILVGFVLLSVKGS